MSEELQKRPMSRRDMLKLAGKGALLVAAGGLVPEALSRIRTQPASAHVQPVAPTTRPAAPIAATLQKRLAATDGYINLPGKSLYVFGFQDVPFDASMSSLDVYQGRAETPAPLVFMDQDAEAFIRLTNLGFVVRPDLDDAHTIHWHGFRNQYAIFDGVPEVSIGVPAARDFDYYFQPRDEGTYMYHCHFEDVEHVQMGMTGVVFVRPRQNQGIGLIPPGNYAYNDRDGSTAYDREVAMLVQDYWSRAHDNGASIQESPWSDYDPDYWVINGRCYPDTVKPNRGEPGEDPSLSAQPVSSLVQANAGEKVLLRIANLGYQQHAMQLAGIPMKVVGEDATYLGRLPSGRADITYVTNTLYIGPGESRDVLFTAPPHSTGVGSTPDIYLFKNRNLDRTTNPGSSGLGGMVTEVRIYPAGTLPPQTYPNQTF